MLCGYNHGDFLNSKDHSGFSYGSWEYSNPRILTDIGRGIGTPLLIDRATLEGNYGHFARVLLGISFSYPTTTYGIGHSLGFPSRILQYHILPNFWTLEISYSTQFMDFVFFYRAYPGRALSVKRSILLAREPTKQTSNILMIASLCRWNPFLKWPFKYKSRPQHLIGQEQEPEGSYSLTLLRVSNQSTSNY